MNSSDTKHKEQLHYIKDILFDAWAWRGNPEESGKKMSDLCTEIDAMINDTFVPRQALEISVDHVRITRDNVTHIFGSSPENL